MRDVAGRVLAVIRAGSWMVGAPFRWLVIGLVRLYRVSLSGLVGGQCRFYPTCSHYAEQAVREHGAVRGVGLATWRLLRCGPFSGGGVDPVPPGRRARAGQYDSITQSVTGGTRP